VKRKQPLNPAPVVDIDGDYWLVEASVNLAHAAKRAARKDAIGPSARDLKAAA
jgi:hypothetical protein